MGQKMQRRDFMKQALCGAAALGLKGSARAAKTLPNVVFMLADDLGWRDLGCCGSTFYETPNLDRLAAQGMRFTQAYAACPVCSPTRASLLTGQYPTRTGITDYIGAPQPNKWNHNTQLLPAPYTEQLTLDKVTLADALKAQGYATGFFGKWHLGGPDFFPERQGFDVNVAGCGKGHPPTYFSPYKIPNLTDGPPGEHLPDRLARETCQFIETHKTRPFLAYLAFYDVHTPLMAREDLRQKYLAKKQRLGLKAGWGREGQSTVRLTQDHAVYAGMVEAMDEAAGKVLAKLEELGLSENTIVVFTSDNGGLSTSEGWPTSNVPLRGGKGWLYEGGIREPLLVRWPGVAAPGSTSDVPISSPDFYPTLLAAAGAVLPAQQIVDGLDLKPILQGGAAAERALFWHYPHYGNQGGTPGAAIRRGDWKFIEWFEDNRAALYNLALDSSETQDLSAQEPARMAQLRDELHAWQKQTGAQFPTANPHYDATKPPRRATPGADS